jgi:ATPase subunit of ABC transporter with duplicated ATPase domains
MKNAHWSENCALTQNPLKNVPHLRIFITAARGGIIIIPHEKGFLNKVSMKNVHWAGVWSWGKEQAYP